MFIIIYLAIGFLISFLIEDLVLNLSIGYEKQRSLYLFSIFSVAVLYPVFFLIRFITWVKNG